MKDLPAIARYMRLQEELLRFPVELLNQGYEPNYLATYRPDELGGLDSKTLSRLKRSVVYEASLSDHKEQIAQTLQKDGLWSDAIWQVISQCTSISQADAIAKNLRGKKTAKAFAETDPNIEKVGQAILLHRGENVQDLQGWIQSQTELGADEAQALIPKVKRWLQLLLSEDAQLMLTLQRALLKNAIVTVKVLPEPAKESEQGQLQAAEPPTESTPDTTSEVPEVQSVETLDPTTSDATDPSDLQATQIAGDSPDAQASTSEPTTAEAPSAETHAAQTAATAEPSIASFKNERKKPKELKTKSLSDKQLSPRQRRRRWLRGILESYSKLRKPLRELTPFQVLMLSRGIRSQIIHLHHQIDIKPLVQLCRDSLCPGRHPMHPLLMEVSESGLKEFLLPKLQQDVLGILEEDANQALIESAVDHLETVMLQRPVRGHRILLIDAVGQKTAAVAVVDAQGNLLMTDEIICNSSKPDVVSQNVTQLGQWVHKHQVTLVALTNGHARRYLIHSVAELMKQSAEGSLYWTFVDRQGADAFCISRNSLVELPKISRRHRAAVWLAWKLQDPLRQILKIEPARLRLGSYQRELPQAELESALQEAISSAITKAGVDMYHADLEVLKRIPGMDDPTAKRLVEERPKGTITNRDSLLKFLKESLPDNKARQAIGFLRVYQSDVTLDGTIIHPEDYRLAERLVAHAQLPAPPASPEGWTKPDYEKLAAAMAAVQGMAIDGPNSEIADNVEAFGFEAHSEEINPNFGLLDESDPSAVSDPTDPTEPSAVSDQTDPTDQTAVSDQTDPTDQTDPSAVSDPTDPTDQTDPSAVSDPTDQTDPSAVQTTRVTAGMPAIPEGPMERPALAIDSEKLARSWQVGKSKLLSVSRALQFPFADGREFQYPVPVRSFVPSMDRLEPGTMLPALVIGIANFGVFVELGPDCTGLVHVSQLGQSFVEDAHQFVQVGDVVPVWVLNTDHAKKRVALTMRSPGSVSEPPPGNQPSNDPRNRQDRPERQDRRGANRPNASSGSQPRGERSNRPDDRRSRPSGDSRGFNRRQDSRGQNRQESSDASERSNRPVRISRPVPEKPISEAMQQGKEPLRSFGDLMQFLKKGPTASEASPVASSDQTPSPTGNTTAGEPPASDSPAKSNPEGVDTQTTGDGDVGV